MKKQLVYLFVVISTILLASCSKEQIIIKPDYPLSNFKYYQLIDNGNVYTFNFYKNWINFSKPGFGSSYNYGYKHPIVTVETQDTIYQWIVGENYLKYVDKDGKEYYFYERRRLNPLK